MIVHDSSDWNIACLVDHAARASCQPTDFEITDFLWTVKGVYNRQLGRPPALDRALLPARRALQ
jgi:hypothetical protein